MFLDIYQKYIEVMDTDVIVRKFVVLQKLLQGEDFQIFNFLLNLIVSSLNTNIDSIKQGLCKLLFPVYILIKQKTCNVICDAQIMLYDS